jgi:hypothetical protein
MSKSLSDETIDEIADKLISLLRNFPEEIHKEMLIKRTLHNLVKEVDDQWYSAAGVCAKVNKEQSPAEVVYELFKHCQSRVAVK